jgi:hypothetical protein
MATCMSQTDDRILVENIHNCDFGSDGGSHGTCNLAWLHALRVQQMRRSLLQRALMTDLHLRRKLGTRNTTIMTGPQAHSLYMRLQAS